MGVSCALCVSTPQAMKLSSRAGDTAAMDRHDHRLRELLAAQALQDDERRAEEQGTLMAPLTLGRLRSASGSDVVSSIAVQRWLFPVTRFVTAWPVSRWSGSPQMHVRVMSGM